MSYNYQDAPTESQQEYFGKVHTDNKEMLYNALKRIEELEKDLADYQFNYPTIKELEQENEELKILRCCENCKNVNLQLHWRESEEIDKRRQFVCGTCGNRKHWEYLGKAVGITETQQLTKATEIIKGLYFIIQSRIDYENNTGLADEMWRAEQFMKEIEK